jgi:adenosylmethionine-8-amino-7-oxononanoate aminotransferase
MTLGKGLTGGYMPVAATLTSQAVFDAFRGEAHQGKTFYHGHTFTGNALGCAAAVASIDLIHSSGLLERLPAKVAYLAGRLSELAQHPNVADIRQCGMMVGIELAAGREPFEPFDSRRLVGAAVCKAARGRGLIIRPLGDVVVLMPAPAMDAATLERMTDAVIETICEYFA